MVKDVITPNISDPWIKPFKLSGAHQYTKVKKVVDILEMLESDEKIYHNQREKKRDTSNYNKQKK